MQVNLEPHHYNTLQPLVQISTEIFVPGYHTTLRVVGDVAPSHTTPGFLIIYRLIIKFSYLLWIYIFTRNAYFAKGVIAQWGYHNLDSRKLVLLGAFDPIGDAELPTKLRPGEGPRNQILANLWFL